MEEARACSACSTAKRKCSRQSPNCQRCKVRGLDCVYPALKPSSFTLCETRDTPTPELDTLSPPKTDLLPYFADSRTCATTEVGPFASVHIPDSGLVSIVEDFQHASSWFTSSETWKVDRFPQGRRGPHDDQDIKRYIQKCHRWLAEWVEKGSNPFIHAGLYRFRFPRCVQDAFSALTCYLCKTESNEHMVFEIIEERATQLIANCGISSEDSLLGKTSAPANSLDHVARVQALLIYQTICLYDGHIRLRRLAESYIPVLVSWMRQMVHSASQATFLGQDLVSSSQNQNSLEIILPGSPIDQNILWYSWILAESIRRTWVVAATVQTLYLLQRDKTAPCQGAMMITTRQGVWKAQSATAWETICSEVNIGLLQMVDAEKLFIEATPDEVDDFAQAILEAAFGTDRMEQWGVRIPC